MAAKPKKIGVTQAQAKFPALADEVQRTGRSIVVTKRGKPLVKLVPAGRLPIGALKGSVLHMGDIISPIDVEWDAEK